MSEYVESVKRISAFFEERRKVSPETWQAKFDGFVADLDAAANELVRLYSLTSALPPELGNVHDLPEELLAELSVAKTDELEDQIVTVINAYGGEASLDQVLVGLYRKFQVVQKRRFIQNKLYRMEMVWSVDGRKGVYTTSQPQAGLLDDPELQSITRNLDDEIPW